ncbi:hypothetical protein [Bradyrhizobium sp. CCGUVB23]|uniref:hypothetical protein n=1 Tax=Bradyrhizobium sp. CCGUVB23 TaxID=2949630 RepID=UPI0020B1C310|nr:hypothetical protein [Bradyrhizobium sp. CCGUVB23]MCP3459515.1 hypothetical protein [Bradyrhizobium sp. CCGUVB23]
MRKRKRSDPHTFEQRLEEHRLRLEGELAKLQGAKLQDGRQRELLVARLEQLQAAAEMHEFLSLRR